MHSSNQTQPADDEEIIRLRARLADLEQEASRLKKQIAAQNVSSLVVEDATTDNEVAGIDPIQFYDLFIQAPVVVVVQRGPAHVIEFLNPTGKAVLGGRKIIGLSALEAFPEPSYQYIRDLLDKVYRNGQSFYLSEQELEIKQTDGSFRIGFFNIVYQPWRDAENQIVGVLTFGIEVTEQKIAQEALGRSEERFREVQEASLDSFILLKIIYDEQRERVIDFEYEYFNPSATKIIRRSLEDLKGKQMRVEFPGVEVTGVFEQYQKVAETGEASISEVYYHYDGLNEWLRISVVKLKNEIAVFFTDITARKKIEEKERFLAEVSKILVSSLDYVSNLSQVARQTIAYLADYCLFDLVESQDPLTFQRLVTAHVDPTKEAIVREIDHKYPLNLASEHPLIQILARNEPIAVVEMTDEDVKAQAHDEEHLRLLRFLNPRSIISLPLVVRGRLVGAFSLISEQPGRYQNKEEVALAEELARRASVAIDNALLYEEAQKALTRQKELDFLKDQFLSMVSHDLRTPLTSVKGYAQILERQFQKYSERPTELSSSNLDTLTRSTRVIVHQAGRMQELIVRLLEFSRIQADRLELKYTPNNLVTFVQQIVAQQNIGSDHPRLSLQTSLTELYLSYDEARLEQVLDNLIGNALKYSPLDAPVLVGVELQSDEAIVSVRDQGMGIAPEQQKHLFEQFYRVRNDQTNHIEGLGLGLYISAEIINQHKGRIWIESDESQGSTFYFSLPLN